MEMDSCSCHHSWISSEDGVPQLPRSRWQIGKVGKVFPGPDSHVRTSEVQIKDRVYTRPIVHLIVLLEIPDDEASGP